MSSSFGTEETKRLTHHAAGRLVAYIEIDDDSMENFIIIKFVGGSSIRIKYDYIYNCDVMLAGD